MSSIAQSEKGRGRKIDDRRQRTKQGDGWMNRRVGWDKGPFSDLRFHSTFDIIEAVEGGRFPERVMMTFHCYSHLINTQENLTLTARSIGQSTH